MKKQSKEKYFIHIDLKFLKRSIKVSDLTERSFRKEAAGINALKTQKQNENIHKIF